MQCKILQVFRKQLWNGQITFQNYKISFICSLVRGHISRTSI